MNYRAQQIDRRQSHNAGYDKQRQLTSTTGGARRKSNMEREEVGAGRWKERRERAEGRRARAKKLTSPPSRFTTWAQD